MFYEEAVTRCIADDIEWGERCDEETGLLKLPTSIPPYWLPFEGDNGEQRNEVTEDTINIVYWRWMENDFILQYIISILSPTMIPTLTPKRALRKCSNTTKRTTRLTEEK